MAAAGERRSTLLESVLEADLMLGDHDPAESVPNLLHATMPLLVNDVVAAFLRTARARSSVRTPRRLCALKAAPGHPDRASRP
jgi:hypothetical protein